MYCLSPSIINRKTVDNVSIDDGFIDLTYPRRKRLFLDFKSNEYSRDRGQTRASDKKHLSKLSKIGSKNSSSKSSASASGSASASASDKSDARSRESSERDDDYDSSDRIDGERDPRYKVHDNLKGSLTKCQDRGDDEALLNHSYTSTRNNLRRSACKTEVVPQLSAVDFGPKTSRVGIDYQVRDVM